jgi:hypothetical protein
MATLLACMGGFAVICVMLDSPGLGGLTVLAGAALYTWAV